MPQNNDNTTFWLIAAAVVGATAYILFRPKRQGPGQTQAAPLPPLAPPSDFPTLGAVSTAFDNLKTNWRMGRLDPRQAWDVSMDLLAAIESLQKAGIGDPASAQELVRQIEILRQDISDYIALSDVA